jgi:hypothetical protein
VKTTRQSQKSAKSPSDKKSAGFTDDEQAAMRERARELKTEARRGPRADNTEGESDEAKLDEGAMWSTSFALTQLTPAEEARIAALVRKALS